MSPASLMAEKTSLPSVRSAVELKTVVPTVIGLAQRTPLTAKVLARWSRVQTVSDWLSAETYLPCAFLVAKASPLFATFQVRLRRFPDEFWLLRMKKCLVAKA